MGWGIYLRNHFLHPKHSQIRAKFLEFSPFFEADMISAFFFELLWTYARGETLNATVVKAIMDAHPMLTVVEPQLELAEVLDLLGKTNE